MCRSGKPFGRTDTNFLVPDAMVIAVTQEPIYDVVRKYIQRNTGVIRA